MTKERSFLDFDGEKIMISNDVLSVFEFLSEIDKEVKSIIDFSDSLKAPVRSQFIVLFAYLETLLCIWIGYNEKIYKKQEIIKRSTSENRRIYSQFIKNYVLTENNKYYKNQAHQMNETHIKQLRNDLTHFFSTTDKFILVPDSSIDITQRLRLVLARAGRKDITIISPKDLYQLIRHVGISLIVRNGLKIV